MAEPLPLLNRSQLSKMFNGDNAAIRSYDTLQRALQFVPDGLPSLVVQIQAAQATADAAALLAAALKLVPYLVLTADGTVDNERALAVDPLALKLTDAGAGSTLTVASTDIRAVLPADVSDTTAALVNATGLALNLEVNATYMVDGLITLQSAATTTGAAFGFTLPAGASISGGYTQNTTATALEGSYNIASGAVKGATTAVLVAAENVPVTGRWIIKMGATAGASQLQFRTEIAASAVTLKAGLSALLARRIA